MAQMTDEQFEKFMAQRKAESDKQAKCPTCGARVAREEKMRRFHHDILDYLRDNRMARLDSCIQCVEKHVSRAMTYAEELLTANGSGTANGTAAVNVEINYLKVLGHLGCAIEESEDYTTLHTALIEAERLYRYEGIAPDWKRIASLILQYKK